MKIVNEFQISSIDIPGSKDGSIKVILLPAGQLPYRSLIRPGQSPVESIASRIMVSFDGLAHIGLRDRIISLGEGGSNVFGSFESILPTSHFPLTLCGGTLYKLTTVFPPSAGTNPLPRTREEFWLPLHCWTEGSPLEGTFVELQLTEQEFQAATEEIIQENTLFLIRFFMSEELALEHCAPEQKQLGILELAKKL